MGKTQLHIVQQKTQEVISLPLSKEALKQLPKRNGALDTDIIFHDLISLGRTNEILSRWAQAAGINKHITFHVARHTHATMMIHWEQIFIQFLNCWDIQIFKQLKSMQRLSTKPKAKQLI